jgi:hypothetical protein
MIGPRPPAGGSISSGSAISGGFAPLVHATPESQATYELPVQTVSESDGQHKGKDLLQLARAYISRR